MPRESLTDKLLAKSKRVLEVGSEAADVLVHLQHGVSPLGVAAVGLRVVNSIRGLRAKSPEEYFSEWKPLELGALANQGFAAMAADPDVTFEDVPSLHDHSPAVVTKVDGLEIAWGITGRPGVEDTRVRGCWVPREIEADAAMHRIGRSLWTMVGGSGASIEPCFSSNGDQRDVRLVAEPNDEKILPSAKGLELYERITRFRAKNKNRSTFVIGHPGVGKSCMLRYIASMLGGFRLRLRLKKMGGIEPHEIPKIPKIAQILRPNVLTMDDLDRFVMGDSSYRDDHKNTDEASAMLDPLEALNRLVPVVLSSANFSENITHALIRPGRFAELETLEQVDPDLYEQLLPGAPPHIIAKLKKDKIPLAYIDELGERIEVLGYEEAAKEMTALFQRTEDILDLNKKVIRRRRRKKRNSLAGKTPAQKAGLLVRESVRLEREAAKFANKAQYLRDRAERRRATAEQERTKAAKKKTSKKKTSKKKTSKSRSRKKKTKNDHV